MSANVTIGPITTITIVFVVLKLTHVIAWSWWWVLSPLWLAALFILGVFLTILIFAIIIGIVKGILS